MSHDSWSYACCFAQVLASKKEEEDRRKKEEDDERERVRAEREVRRKEAERAQRVAARAADEVRRQQQAALEVQRMTGLQPGGPSREERMQVRGWTPASLTCCISRQVRHDRRRGNIQC